MVLWALEGVGEGEAGLRRASSGRSCGRGDSAAGLERAELVEMLQEGLVLFLKKQVLLQDHVSVVMRHVAAAEGWEGSCRSHCVVCN